MLSVKFKPDEVLVTPGAAMALEESGLDASFFLEKHICGDWGDVDEVGRKRNDESLRSGGRMISTFNTLLGKRLGVITPPDRSVSVILELPDSC